MPIKGFVEYADGARVRGWAYDPAFPSRRLEVVVQLADKVCASGRADIYRNDLVAAGIDDGGHGFSIDVASTHVPADAAGLLRVYAVSGDEKLTLRRAQAKAAKVVELTADNQTPVSDATQFPV